MQYHVIPLVDHEKGCFDGHFGICEQRSMDYVSGAARRCEHNGTVPRNTFTRMLFSYVDLLATYFLAVVVPGYRSFKAIRHKDLREYQAWLMYWIVYAFLATVQLPMEILMSWLPFYTIFKYAGLIWLVAPQSKGAVSLYKQWLHYKLKEYEPQIDETVVRARELLYDQFSGVIDQAVGLVRDNMNMIVFKVLESQQKSGEMDFKSNEIKASRSDDEEDTKISTPRNGRKWPSRQTTPRKDE